MQRSIIISYSLWRRYSSILRPFLISSLLIEFSLILYFIRYYRMSTTDHHFTGSICRRTSNDFFISVFQQLIHLSHPSIHMGRRQHSERTNERTKPFIKFLSNFLSRWYVLRGEKKIRFSVEMSSYLLSFTFYFSFNTATVSIIRYL